MPCYDPLNDRCNAIQSDKIIYTESRQLVDKCNWLEAALCAIITELEKRNIAQEIIKDAKKHGVIGIDDFWVNHSDKDKERLSKELEKYSDHEKDILLHILKTKR